MTNNTPSRRGSERDAADYEERKHGSPTLRPLMDAKDLNLLASLSTTRAPTAAAARAGAVKQPTPQPAWSASTASSSITTNSSAAVSSLHNNQGAATNSSHEHTGALPTTATTTRTRPRTRGVRGGRRSHAKGWLAEAKGEPKDHGVELATVQCVFKETKGSTDEGQEPARDTATPLPLRRRPGLAMSVPESKGGESKVDGARGATESKLPPSPKSTMPPLPTNGPTNGPAGQTTLKSASEPFAPTPVRSPMPVQSPTPVRSPMPVRALRFGTSELTPEPFLKSTPLKATSTGWQPSSSASAASAASTAGWQLSPSPLLCDAMPVVAVSYARTPSPPLATKSSLSPPFLSIYAPQAPHHVPLAPLAPLAMQQPSTTPTTPTPLTPLAPLASQASPSKVKLAAMDEFMFERIYEISCSGQQIKFCYTAKNILVNGSMGRFL